MMQGQDAAGGAIMFWDAAAPINAAAWSADGKTAAVAAGDGKVYLLRHGMDVPLGVEVDSGGAVIALAADGEVFYAGSDTGVVAAIEATGQKIELARYPGQFIEHVLPVAFGMLAVGTGKTVRLLDRASGAEKRALAPHPSAVAGLAASPVGPRLAVAHYGGVSVWPLDNAKASPRILTWKGAHGALTYSPDGKWLVSAMQEQALHLWRLGDGLDLQMRGYPGKITMLSWAHDGFTLATDGGSGVPLWSFKDAKGPAGTQAQVIGDSGGAQVLVSAVACHPKGPFAAVGYKDGLVLLVNTTEDKAVLLKEPGAGAVTTLAWDKHGLSLVAGSDQGWLGLMDFAKLGRV